VLNDFLTIVLLFEYAPGPGPRFGLLIILPKSESLSLDAALNAAEVSKLDMALACANE